MSFLFPGSSDSRLGGKGAALSRLGGQGFRIPPWFAVAPEESWTDGELKAALADLGKGPFAVRSSASQEDGSGHSFAGQYDTLLEIPAAGVAEAIGKVRASAHSNSVKTYCRERGLSLPETPTVLVQRMIDPRVAGVAFSSDPVSGRRKIAIVSAVEGTGEKLVSGEVDGEAWEIGPDAVKGLQSGLLSQDEAKAIAQLSRNCTKASGVPQDIEWAIDREGVLWLLQSRPITTLAHLPDPDDELRVWDNSNIAESYGGVTTPLTFSFARRVYESVYREFCRLMSVPAKRIERADDVFGQMLGLIRGRTYYNLASWYRVLALLPGFSLNRSFMEQMMGVKRPLSEKLVGQIIAESSVSPMEDRIALVRTCGGLVHRLVTLGKEIDVFQKRLDLALAMPASGLELMSGEELVRHYRDLERQLLKRWDAPLVNDFFAMIFYGALRSLCIRWAGDEDGTLQNELLAETGGIISAEPPRRIRRMAELAAKTDGLPALLASAEATPQEKRSALRKSPGLDEEFERYLADFGDRCLEELKLESPTVNDDASTLLTSIGAMALRGNFSEERRAPAPRPSISGPIQAIVFRWVLSETQKRVRQRENLRFERTRLFGRVRGIFRELGKRLHADGRLASASDVFYLELGEVLAAFEGTGSSTDLAGLAALRQAEFESHRQSSAPPDRFQTTGPLHRYREFEADAEPQTEGETSGDQLKGMGACPGKVTGKVRVVLDPRTARLEPGEILVAQQTDPGWVVLFPAASGLLVERGSLLSHSAIVSRELNLPCVVSIPSVTSLLKTGDRVEMDGAKGTIRILERA